MSELSAREAVTAAAFRGDVAMLRAVAADLPPREAYRYDRERATAFVAALEGDRDGAFAHLWLGGVETTQRRDVDVAVIQLLLGDPVRALATVRAAVSDTAQIEPDATAVLAECVRRGGRRPRLAAVRVGNGTSGWRTLSVAGMLRVLARDRFEAVLPLLSLVALSVAIVGLLRLPSLLDGDDWSLPGLREREPVIVVAKAPPEATPRPRQEREGQEPATRPTSTPASVLVVARRPSRVAPAQPVAAPGPSTTAPEAPRPPTTAPEAPQPAAPEVRTLASAPPTAQAPPAVTGSKPPHEPRGRARGHEKRTQREQTAPAPFSAPDPSPADVPAAANPGPPEHANGHGRDEAPGQRKKP